LIFFGINNTYSLYQKRNSQWLLVSQTYCHTWKSKHQNPTPRRSLAERKTLTRAPLTRSHMNRQTFSSTGSLYVGEMSCIRSEREIWRGASIRVCTKLNPSIVSEQVQLDVFSPQSRMVLLCIHGSQLINAAIDR
jgi:hypothetical protein